LATTTTTDKIPQMQQQQQQYMQAANSTISLKHPTLNPSKTAASTKKSECSE